MEGGTKNDPKHLLEVIENLSEQNRRLRVWLEFWIKNEATCEHCAKKAKELAKDGREHEKKQPAIPSREDLYRRAMERSAELKAEGAKEER